MSIARRDSARPQQLAAVRVPGARRRRRSRHPTRRRHRDGRNRGRRAGWTGDAFDACTRSPDGSAVRRHRRTHRRVCRRARFPHRRQRPSVSRFRGRTAAQRPQTRTARPNSTGARARSPAGEGSTARLCRARGVASRDRPPGARQDGRRGRARSRRADVLYVAGLDRKAGPARRLRGRPRLLARRRGLAHRERVGHLPRRFGRAACPRRPRRPVRAADMGPDPRRTAASPRHDAVGGARFRAVDAARRDPRSRLGAAAPRRRSPVGWTRGYPARSGHSLRRRPQRSRSGVLPLGASGVGPCSARRLPGAREGGRVRQRHRAGVDRGRHCRRGPAAAVSGSGDLHRRCFYRSVRAVHRRSRPCAVRAGRPGVAAAVERATGTGCSATGPAGPGDPGLRCRGRRFDGRRGDRDGHTDTT